MPPGYMVVAFPEVQQFIDVLPTDLLRAAQQPRVQADLGEQFQRFHTVIGGHHIAAYRQRAMAHPLVAEWVAAAALETRLQPAYEF